MIHSPLRILLVEDHHIMRRGLASLLRAELAAEIVAEVGDGIAALEALKQVSPDVILMDIFMPHMNGLEATRRIKRKHPGIPVLILSMYNNPKLVIRALQAGASGYILKESMVEELVRALQTVIQGNVFISSLVLGVEVESYLAGIRLPEIDPLQALTTRECEILQLLAEGKTVSQIAQTLIISENTVYTHQKNIKTKLGLRNRAEMVRFALEHDMITWTENPNAAS